MLGIALGRVNSKGNSLLPRVEGWVVEIEASYFSKAEDSALHDIYYHIAAQRLRLSEE